MSLEERLRRAKSAREVERRKEELERAQAEREKKRTEEERELKIRKRKKQAVANLGRVVKKLLDQVGMVEWGRMIVFKRYAIIESWSSEDCFTWIVRHSVRRWTARSHSREREVKLYNTYEWYGVYLWFDDDGNPSSCQVVGDVGVPVFDCKPGYEFMNLLLSIEQTTRRYTCDISEESIAGALERMMREGPGIEQRYIRSHYISDSDRGYLHHVRWR